jgi:RNA polymerase sigma factor (sigma-70 family)
MTANRLDSVLRHVRNIGGRPADDLPDADLLGRFATNRDEAAFAVLVRRHGPMVLGVCQRLLANHQSAEDAFQATFLLLAKKARWLRRPEGLGPWLYGVARRVAHKARSRLRFAVNIEEVTVTTQSEADPSAAAEWSELRGILDDAIARLPQRYRAPVVLCYLQGLTNAEAAARLRCPLGTVATRLSRARDRLRALLTRHGVAPATGALTAALTPDVTAAFVSDVLLRSTARWAAALAANSAATIPIPILSLTREVAQTMILDKLKLLAVLLVIGVAGAGVALSGSSPTEDAPPKPATPPAKADSAPKKLPAAGGAVSLARLKQPPPAAYRVDVGDVLGIYVEGILGERGTVPPIINLPQYNGNTITSPPAVGYPIPVQEDGTILLPIVPPKDVRGKTVVEIREQIEQNFKAQQIIAPGSKVLVSVAKPRTYRVTVFNHISPDEHRNAMMSLDLPAYENDVLTALSKSYGLPQSRERVVVVIERLAADGNLREIRLPLRSKAGEPLPFKPEDVVLKSGDVLTIEQLPEMRDGETYAVAMPDGRVLIRRRADGYYQPIVADTITATETDGTRVADFADRLKSMKTVYVSYGFKPPAPESLRDVNPGTLILTIRE